MDDPPMTPTDLAPGAVATFPSDAYVQFWDCIESDAPAGDEAARADDAPADAYYRFWELNEI
jgi:hypothetical protein